MYNFDKLTNRFNTSSLKWDVIETELPMWVADMDFEVAPKIVDSIKKRCDTPIFGYNIIPDSWYDAYINWWGKYHNLKIEKDNLMFSTGVVPSISSIIRKMSTTAEKVVILTPVYNIFYNSIINNGRRVVESKMIYKDNEFIIDYNDLEKKLSDKETSILLFCNPHNPTGHVWSKEELIKVSDICKKYNILIISDEIHCDLCDPNILYTPFSSVNEWAKNNVITLIAPTKTFNLAGLQTSAILIYNLHLKNKVERGINTDEIAEPNTFAIPVVVSAFNECRDWNIECVNYIYQNKQIVKKFIIDNKLDLTVVNASSLYLMWIDVRKYSLDSEYLCDFIREKTGLYLSSGPQFGLDGFIRLNVACPKERLNDGLLRLKKGLELFRGDKN